MHRTREEIAALLKKSEQTRRKSAEIQRQLHALMAYVDRVLRKGLPSKRRIKQ